LQNISNISGNITGYFFDSWHYWSNFVAVSAAKILKYREIFQISLEISRDIFSAVGITGVILWLYQLSLFLWIYRDMKDYFRGSSVEEKLGNTALYFCFEGSRLVFRPGRGHLD